MFYWLQNIVDYIVYGALGMDKGKHLTDALNFFIYDSVKILIGLFMLDIIKIKFIGLGKLNEKMEEKGASGFWSVLLLGIVFAFGFCPYSGVLYFGMLIPMTISSASGLYLSIILHLEQVYQ